MIDAYSKANSYARDELIGGLVCAFSYVYYVRIKKLVVKGFGPIFTREKNLNVRIKEFVEKLTKLL